MDAQTQGQVFEERLIAELHMLVKLVDFLQQMITRELPLLRGEIQGIKETLERAGKV